MIPVSVKTTPSRAASDSTRMWNRLSKPPCFIVAGVAVVVDRGGASTSSTSQFRPLPPRYISLPPRSLHPRLDGVVHRPRPVFRMRREDQHLVRVEVERAVVKLGLGVVVVGEVLALEPAQQPPLGRRDVAGGPAFDRVGDLGRGVDVVDRLGPVERERRVVVGVVRDVVRVGVPLQLEPRVDRRASAAAGRD